MPDGHINVINKLGLHARACGKLIEITTRYPCQILLGRDDNLVDAKNIMAVLMLGAGCGTTLRLKTEGEQAEAADAAIRQLFADRFGEGQ